MVNEVAKAIQPFFCGGFSACFASICIHPIDLTKVRLQVTPPPATALSVATNIFRTEGPIGLYAGLSASVTRQATYGTARIGLHSVFSDKLKAANGGKDIPLWQKFASSTVSGALASIIGNPFDVSLVRMQSDSGKPAAQRKNYTNVGNAVSRIIREEGFWALYRGYPPTLLRAISMNVGMMTTYDASKELIIAQRGKGVGTDLLAAGAAGFFCAFLSLPFDMMKTRLQNMQPDVTTGKMPYAGVADCATKIYTEEGVLRFWRGFSTYYGRCAPHAMIILLVREQVIKVYGNAFGLQQS